MEEETEKAMERMRAAMAELYDKRQQALKRFCPNCWGSLQIKDICAVTCPDCLLVFSVDEILANTVNKKG